MLFAPDYVINAGGIISVAHERLELGGDREVDTAIGRIPQRLAEIFAHARQENRPTNEVADRFAQDKIRTATRHRAVA